MRRVHKAKAKLGCEKENENLKAKNPIRKHATAAIYSPQKGSGCDQQHQQ